MITELMTYQFLHRIKVVKQVVFVAIHCWSYPSTQQNVMQEIIVEPR